MRYYPPHSESANGRGFPADQGLPANRVIRTNQQWLDSLRGVNGEQAQRAAHHDLACYLYVVISRQIGRRVATLPKLVYLHDDELDSLVQDFLQSFMLKMAFENYAMLDKFTGTGRFLAWAAQIANNLVLSEFRRVEWRNKGMSDEHEHTDVNTSSPEEELLQKDLSHLVEQCLSHLPEHYQHALRRCIMQGDNAKEVAEEMDITQNAVHILVYRAKKAMLKQLEKRGIGPDSLTLFAW